MMKFAASLLAAVVVGEVDFRSGSVSTYEKFRYGKFVTRMKAPDRKGTVASFFTYWDGPNFDPLEWNELDMEIVPSVEENPLSMNVIYGDGHDKVESHDYGHEFNPHDDWHTYEMEWTPHYIAWIVDGNEIRHVKMEDPAVKNLDKPQSLRMNFWTPTFESWGAGFNAHDMPWYVLYDYVEVFTYDQEHNEFKFHWRDDFDSFDSGKWHKAAGGFESNTSVFHPENVFTSGGHLILKMEPEHTRAEDYELKHSIKSAFEMDLDHSEPNMNDFDSDSDSYRSRSRGSDHTDDYHHGQSSSEYYEEDHRLGRVHEDKHYDHEDYHPGYHMDREYRDKQDQSEDRRLGFVHPQHHDESPIKHYEPTHYDEHYQLPARHEDSHYYEHGDTEYHPYYHEYEGHYEPESSDYDTDTETDSDADYEEYMRQYGDQDQEYRRIQHQEGQKYTRQTEKRREKQRPREQRKYGIDEQGDQKSPEGMLPEQMSEEQLQAESRSAQFFRPVKKTHRSPTSAKPRATEKSGQKLSPQPQPKTQPEPAPVSKPRRQKKPVMKPKPSRPTTPSWRKPAHVDKDPGFFQESRPIQETRASREQMSQPEAPVDPSQMSYDQFRLWKHKQKMAKREAKQAQSRPIPELEPDFQTYADFREWKLDQKKKKMTAQGQQKEEEQQYKWEKKATRDPYSPQTTSEKVSLPSPASMDKRVPLDDSRFQHTKLMATGEKPTLQDEDETFQHPAERRTRRKKPTGVKSKPQDTEESFQHPIERRTRRKKPSSETKQPAQAPIAKDFEQPKWQKRQKSQRDQKKEKVAPVKLSPPIEEQTLKKRASTYQTHVFDEDEPHQQKPSRRAHEVPIVHDHERQYYEEQRRQHGQRHVDRHHRHDLFDLDDPETDSDYEDIDLDTGIYHDEDPHIHPAQHVRDHFTDDQYFHSREHYFPEDSYHAAGQMKYDIETVEDLTQHALGKRDDEKKKGKKQASPSASKPAPAPTPKLAPAPIPAPAKPAPTPAPKKWTAPPRPYASGDPSHPFQERAKTLHPYQEPSKQLRKKQSAEKKPKAKAAEVAPKVDDSRPVAKKPVPTTPTHHRKEHYHRWSPQISRDHKDDHQIDLAQHYRRFHRDASKATVAEHSVHQPEIFDLEQEPLHPVIKSEHHHTEQPAKIADHSIAEVKEVESYHHLQPRTQKPPKKEPKKKSQRHKLSEEEISKLRVEHGLNYEREHNVDHFIDHLTHPQYEITGYIDGYGHAHDAQIMDMFAHDHEEEVFGDEHDERKAHLHLHPKRHDYKPHAIAVDHPHYYTGEYRHHAEHKPSSEGHITDHWADVHHHSDYNHDDRHSASERYAYHPHPHPQSHQDHPHPPTHKEEEHRRVVHEGIYYGDTDDQMVHRDLHGRVIDKEDQDKHEPRYERIIYEDTYHSDSDNHHDSHPVRSHHVEYEEPAHSKYEHYSEDSRIGHDFGDVAREYDHHHDLPIEDWMSYEHKDAYRGHHDDYYTHHDDHRRHYSDYDELPMYDVHFDGEHAGYHPELDHKFDDPRDFEPVHFHETTIEHAPNLSDHHSYHIEDFPDYHHMEPIHHDHGPIYHGGQYQYQHQQWAEELPSHTRKTRKHHAKSWRPDLGTDLEHTKTLAPSKSQKKKTSDSEQNQDLVSDKYGRMTKHHGY